MTSKKSKESKATGLAGVAGHVIFTQPSRADALAYTPEDGREREVMREALIPTLRLWAAALMGRRRDPIRGEAVFFIEEGFRYWLTHDACRDREGVTISKRMVAHVWWNVLREEERVALVAFAERAARSGARVGARAAVTDDRAATLFDMAG